MPIKQYKRSYKSFTLKRKLSLDKVHYGTTPKKSLYALSFGHIKSIRKATRVRPQYMWQAY